MEKVKITQEQADAIEFAVKNNFRHTLIDAYMKVKGASYTEKLSVLYKLSYDDFFKCLYIGYEVEPTLELGEYIKFQNKRHKKGVVGKITRITGNTLYLDGREYPYYYKCSLSDVKITAISEEEIAEEKERRWWKNNGRDVWELRSKDLVSLPNGKVAEVSFVNEYVMVGTSRMEIGDITEVICFAENRLDVSREDE